jgi:hypothetical protein
MNTLARCARRAPINKLIVADANIGEVPEITPNGR